MHSFILGCWKGRLQVKSVKVCVLRLKNSSRTIIFTKYVYFLLKRTIEKNFKKKFNKNFYRSTTVFNLKHTTFTDFTRNLLFPLLFSNSFPKSKAIKKSKLKAFLYYI